MFSTEAEESERSVRPTATHELRGSAECSLRPMLETDGLTPAHAAAPTRHAESAVACIPMRN